MKITTMSKGTRTSIRGCKEGGKMEDTIGLLNNIIKNMEYIGLLLTEGHNYVPPLNTYNLVMKKLERLKYILENNNLTPEQIREAVRKLEKPINTSDRFYIIDGKSPFYRDSVGEEELHETRY